MQSIAWIWVTHTAVNWLYPSLPTVFHPFKATVFFLCRRFDSNAGSGHDSSNGGPDSPMSIESQLVRREGSMHLPQPADCQVQGTHSDMCIVRVRRNHLVEDALDEIARQYR